MVKKFLFLFAAALFTTAAPVFAATMPQTQSFSGIPNMDGSLTFNKFDDNGGLNVLTSIQVIFDLTSTGGLLILDNDSDQPASGIFEFGAKGGIGSTDVALLNASYLPVVAQLDATHSSGFSLTGDPNPIPNDFNPAPTDGMSYTGSTEYDSDSGLIGSFAFAGYTGTGTYDIDYSVIQWLDYGSVSGIEVAYTPVNVSGEVTVIYTYDIVPEPATVILFCTGVFGLLKRKSCK